MLNLFKVTSLNIFVHLSIIKLNEVCWNCFKLPEWKSPGIRWAPCTKVANCRLNIWLLIYKGNYFKRAIPYQRHNSLRSYSRSRLICLFSLNSLHSWNHILSSANKFPFSCLISSHVIIYYALWVWIFFVFGTQINRKSSFLFVNDLFDRLWPTRGRKI